MDHAFEAGDRLKHFTRMRPCSPQLPMRTSVGQLIPCCVSAGLMRQSSCGQIAWRYSISHLPSMGARGVDAGVQGCPMCRHGMPALSRDCRGGHEFPFVGTFTTAAVIAEAGSTAADAWARVHRNPHCLREVDLLRIRSGLDALDLLKGNVHRLILQVAEQDGPREADPTEVWIYKYRMWQQGRREWRDPSTLPVASYKVGSRVLVLARGSGSPALPHLLCLLFMRLPL